MRKGGGVVLYLSFDCPIVAADDEGLEEGEDRLPFFASSTKVFSIMSYSSEERETRRDRKGVVEGRERKRESRH